jgi:concentrative nucleoside transporter, CNT family
MERFTGLLGIVFILGIAWFFSNNRKAINYRTVGVGLLLQAILAIFILKTAPGKWLFKFIGDGVTKVIDFSQKGAEFVFGPLVDFPAVNKAFGNPYGFIFFFKIMPTILFVAVLVNIGYYFGIIQRVVQVLAKGLFWLMKVSGAEALSNIASAFVGQVEAQIMIQPYLRGMTMSELMASMAGSFACISGGVMAAYIGLGVPAEYLLAASIMAAPGALAIAKIMYPETQPSETAGKVTINVKKAHSNLVDAISAGCSDGLRIGLNVAAMLIGFLALIALINFGMEQFSGTVNHFLAKAGQERWFPIINLDTLLGGVFSIFAFLMGVPSDEIFQAGAFMGQKLVANEFVAYNNLSAYLPSANPEIVKTVKLVNGHPLSAKTIAIVSFALCGFANFGSMGIQIGGIGALEPDRRTDLTKIVFRALVAGTLASYMSATLAGMLI